MHARIHATLMHRCAFGSLSDVEARAAEVGHHVAGLASRVGMCEEVARRELDGIRERLTEAKRQVALGK